MKNFEELVQDVINGKAGQDKLNQLKKLVMGAAIREEIYDYIKKNYDLSEPIPRTVFKDTAKALERSTEQVSYYITTLAYDERLFNLCPKYCGKTLKIINNVIKFMEEKRVSEIPLYELAKRLDYSASEIRNAYYCTGEERIMVVDRETYDNRGRKVVDVVFCG